MLVRLSATDWIPGGVTDEDAVEIAAAFIAHGANGIDVSSGQVAKEEQPQYGRSYQTPFADKIRNRVAAKADVAVIAVGAISSYDDVNSLILAGRCDLVAIGRSHLYDPHWMLHAAADQDYRGDAVGWINRQIELQPANEALDVPFGKSVIGEEMGDLVENIHVFIGQGWNAGLLNPSTGLASVKREMEEIHSIRRNKCT